MNKLLIFTLLALAVLADDCQVKQITFGTPPPKSSNIGTWGVRDGNFLRLDKDGVTGTVSFWKDTHTQSKAAFWDNGIGVYGGKSAQMDNDEFIMIDWDVSNVCLRDAVIGFDSLYGSFLKGGKVGGRAMWEVTFRGGAKRGGAQYADENDADGDGIDSTVSMPIEGQFDHMKFWIERETNDLTNYVIRYITINVSTCCDLSVLCEENEVYNEQTNTCEAKPETEIPVVECYEGKYSWNGECLPCADHCNTCENGTECLSCKHDNRNPPLCACPKGQIDNLGKCEDVPHCSTARYENRVSGSCTVCTVHCVEGYCTESVYYNQSIYTAPNKCSKVCEPCSAVDPPPTNPCSADTCPYNCDGCVNNCLTCLDTNRKAPECRCDEGTYDKNGEDCPPCMPHCKICDSATVCDVCIGEHREIPHCKCKEGYFDKDGVCTQCGPLCKDCDKEETCTSCKDPQRVGEHCRCPDGTYDKDGKCLPCSNKCKTCSDANTCTECEDPARSIENNCVCPPKHWDEHGKKCHPCNDECATCTDNSGCDTCLDESGEKRGPPADCKCESGTWDQKGEVCKDCDIVCETCSEQDSCDTCKDKNRDQETCKCAAKEWDDKGETCHPCMDVCETCVKADACVTCVDKTRKVPECQCYAGSWDNNGVCTPCMPECATCAGPDTCLTCREETRDLPGCKCRDGYFDKAGTCTVYEECSKMEFHRFDDECTSCKLLCHHCPEKPEDKCTPSCASECTEEDLAQDPKCVSLGCLVECEPCGQGEKCIDCMPQCLECENETECTVCRDDSGVRGLPGCLCPPGTFDNGNYEECLNCHASCAECTGEQDTECTSCAEGFNMVEGKCESNVLLKKNTTKKHIGH